MQPQPTSKKPLVFIIVLVLIAGGVFLYMNGSPSDDAISSLGQAASPESIEAQNSGAYVLSLLKQVNSLEIDTSIFESVVYKTLVDYTVEIPPQDVGRANPFAPIGQ